MKSLWLLPLVLLFVSCENVTGTLSLKEDLTVLKKKRKKTVKMIYPKNNYQGKIKVSKSKVKFEFSSKLDGKKIKPIEIKVDKDARDKLKQMQFVLEPEEIAQEFAVKVNRREWSESSDTYHSTESCSYVSHYEKTCNTYCEKVQTSKDGGYKKVCKTSCHDEPVYAYGSQEVSYYYVTSYVDIDLRILAESTDDESLLASFDGGDSNSRKYYSYQGPCY